MNNYLYKILIIKIFINFINNDRGISIKFENRYR